MDESPSPSPAKPGRLFIVGTGPGSTMQLTAAAESAIQASEYVVGNDIYLKMLAHLLDGKKILRSKMGSEIDRARQSLDLARSSVVSLVSGGDPGIYGMASIVLEVAEKLESDVRIEVVPGVTSASSSGSLLGSPLSGDFVAISLSDLLTPWDVIKNRLALAFSMGVPVVIYNPRSHGRPHHFGEAMEIALQLRDPNTPVGVVRNAYREGESAVVTTLEKIRRDHEAVDMHSTVIVGGSESRVWRSANGERIITPRGYHHKYEF